MASSGYTRCPCCDYDTVSSDMDNPELCLQCEELPTDVRESIRKGREDGTNTVCLPWNGRYGTREEVGGKLIQGGFVPYFKGDYLFINGCSE